MGTRIAICACAVAMILVTACPLSEAADRNKLGFGDPKALLPRTPGIQKPAVSQTAQAIPLQEVPDRVESTRAELNTLLPAEASHQMLKRIASELDQALPEVTSRLAKTREVLAGPSAQRVIDLLIGVAKANPGVIKDPEPHAYFVNFGDNALEFKLRVWVELTDRGYSILSELAVAVQEALQQAGIDVPFPQRDLHLVSVSPNAGLDLGTATQPSPPNPTSASDEES